MISLHFFLLSHLRLSDIKKKTNASYSTLAKWRMASLPTTMIVHTSAQRWVTILVKMISSFGSLHQCCQTQIQPRYLSSLPDTSTSSFWPTLSVLSWILYSPLPVLLRTVEIFRMPWVEKRRETTDHKSSLSIESSRVCRSLRPVAAIYLAGYFAVL